MLRQLTSAKSTARGFTYAVLPVALWPRRWQSYATQLALHHLTPQDSLTVVHAVVPQERLPEAVAQAILRKAEGNPFFLEELTRAVAERQALSPDVAIPDTIQGVITARIERLPDTPKRLLQAAAVLGRDVPWRLLEAIWEEPDTLEASLLELQRLEFFYEHVGVEDSVYVFTHALTQEVAYASLLISHRQALHAAAGRALEARYADRLEDVYERLADHYARTTEADKAVEYLTRAAEKAARGLAHAEVVAALEALQTFTAMSGRFEVGRTHLALADLAYAQENRAAAAQHLHQAHRLFVTLQVPRFVEQTAQRARAFAVWLAEESGGMGAHRH